MQLTDPQAPMPRRFSTSYRALFRAATSCIRRTQGNGRLACGQLQRRGAATLTATTTGSSQLQLSLSSGSRSEAQSGQGTNLACTWTGADGSAHNIDPGNCWRPVLWFLPPLSLQPSQLPSYLGALDLGTGAVGFGTQSYRHLQAELVLPNLSNSLTTTMMQRSTADLGLDPHRCCLRCWPTRSSG